MDINDSIGGIAKGIGEGLEAAGRGDESRAKAIDRLAETFGIEHYRQAHAAKRDLKDSINAWEELEKRNLPESLKSRLFSEYQNQLHKGENLKTVFEIFATIPSNDSSYCDPDEIDPDWLDKFREIAERTNTKAKQLLLAKVINGELESPNSLSKRTLTVLDNLSVEEAEIFEDFCSHCIRLRQIPDNWDCVVFLSGHLVEELPEYSETILQEADIIYPSIESRYTVPKEGIDYFANGCWNHFRSKRDSDMQFIEDFPMTHAGQELALLCDLGIANSDWTTIFEQRLSPLN
ncbi:DUF2806 domain-containing protein [Bifidobacterium sp. ESL0790]|uniref:DUF2806 domain-containing protein n=1 Tax=Bifidobacterium sp. ESL0790 TaxID=2983233 RepID=UPI0023F69FA6|nr:DUF2806 domain-containing protein [Bifidobacterium sp. ESL0790]WEV72985.1 DUF2806 domain-containing protein [Bifidobacterium sp. ESL0790]